MNKHLLTSNDLTYPAKLKDTTAISLKRKRTCGLHSDDRDTNISQSKIRRSPAVSDKLGRVDSFSTFIIASEKESELLACQSISAPSYQVSNDLSSLPQELVLKIISYIGPKSTTLISLSSVDKRFHSLMSRVGDAMLNRAKRNFRILLPKLKPVESNLCLFLRHTFSHHSIQSKCNTLKDILEKDFIVGFCLGPIIVRSVVEQRKPQSNDLSTHSRPTASAVSLEEIDSALDISLQLMGLDVLSFFLHDQNVTFDDIDKSLILSERLNIIQHCSETLEYQVLSLAGQCGAKVYKYMKMRQIIKGCWDVNNGKIKDSAEIGDVRRMDRARLLMQLVVCRDMELARQDAKLGYGRKRLAVGRNRVVLQHNLIESLSFIYSR